MREIKFRALDKRTKCIIELLGFKYVGENQIQLFYQDEDGCSTTCTCDKEFIVLMQYTGLKDKNEIEIYECDLILIDQEDDILKIEWDESTARFIMTAYSSYMCDFDNYYGSECEVIGNIYDNPNLLESEE